MTAGSSPMPSTDMHDEQSNQREGLKFDDLPSEIIHLVALELLAFPTGVRRSRKARKEPSVDDSASQFKTYTDPTCALSCVYRRLRRIVFDERRERHMGLRCCARCCEVARMVPDHIRGNVRRVSLKAPRGKQESCVVCREPLYNDASPPPPPLSAMLSLYPKMTSLSVEWSLARRLPPFDTGSGSTFKVFLSHLKSLSIRMGAGRGDLPRNLMAATADLINLLQLPSLVDLSVSVPKIGSIEEVEEGCVMLGNAFGGIASDELDRITVDVGEVMVEEAVNPTIWPAIESLIQTVLQRTTAKNVDIELRYDLEAVHERPRHLITSDGAMLLGGLVPGKERYLKSASKFAACRTSGKGCTVNIELGARWCGHDFDLLSTTYVRHPLPSVDDASEVSETAGLTEDRMEYELFNDSIQELQEVFAFPAGELV